MALAIVTPDLEVPSGAFVVLPILADVCGRDATCVECLRRQDCPGGQNVQCNNGVCTN